MLRRFPLLIIPLIIYNLFAFGSGIVSHDTIQNLLSLKYSVPIKMFSGVVWNFSFGDLLILISLILLFIEVIKATRTTSRAVTNHILSMLVFVIALVEFITLKGFATSQFFFILMMTLFDVIAGYTISIVAAEHELSSGRADMDD